MTDYRQQVKDYFREADKYHHRSRRAAKVAAENYHRAAEWHASAAWLTKRPDRWVPEDGVTPAEWEALAALVERIADSELRNVFRDQASAQFYTRLGRDYEQMAIRDEARTREVMAEASDRWCETHPAVDGDDRTPLEVLDAGLITASEFWQMVRGE